MKKIEELTDEELVNLTSEQINYYIDFACAAAGIALLPLDELGPKPEKCVAQPKTTVYEIAGQFTLDSEHARRILEAFNSGKLYRSTYPGSDYYTKYLEEKNESVKIETVSMYTNEEWQAIKDEYTNYAQRLKEWTTENTEYEKIKKARKETEEEIYDLISAARHKLSKLNKIKTDFARYLVLANNNPEIALKFLRNAYDLSGYEDIELQIGLPV